MKKIAVFFIIIIAIVCSISYLYLNNIANYKNAQKENAKFEIYKDEEIKGTRLASLINQAIDNNKRNEVKKDKQGKYIDNEVNSVNIDIKFIDDDVIYNIEKIFASGIPKFINYYGDITFKCNEVQYHTSQKIKYMQFEQITK